MFFLQRAIAERAVYSFREGGYRVVHGLIILEGAIFSGVR